MRRVVLTPPSICRFRWKARMVYRQISLHQRHAVKIAYWLNQAKFLAMRISGGSFMLPTKDPPDVRRPVLVAVLRFITSHRL